MRVRWCTWLFPVLPVFLVGAGPWRVDAVAMPGEPQITSFCAPEVTRPLDVGVDHNGGSRVGLRGRRLRCGKVVRRVSEASREAVQQDGPPLYGGEREHPGSYPGIVGEALPDGVLVRRADDDQDLALALKRSAEHEQSRVDEIVYEASVIVEVGLPAQVPVPVPWSAPPLAHSVELHSSDARSSGGRPRHAGQRRGSSGPASQLPGLSLLSGPGGRDAPGGRHLYRRLRAPCVGVAGIGRLNHGMVRRGANRGLWACGQGDGGGQRNRSWSAVRGQARSCPWPA